MNTDDHQNMKTNTNKSILNNTTKKITTKNQ